MSDPFESHGSGLTSPATKIYTITPNDGADIDPPVRAISVAASGAVKVTTIGDTTGIIYVVAGAPFPIRVKRVWAADTDATGIVGLV